MTALLVHQCTDLISESSYACEVNSTDHVSHSYSATLCPRGAREAVSTSGRGIYAGLASGSLGQSSWTRTDVVTAMGIGVEA